MYLFGRKSLGAELRGFCAFARVSTAECGKRASGKSTRPAASD
jgi:hypothetical protein